MNGPHCSLPKLQESDKENGVCVLASTPSFWDCYFSEGNLDVVFLLRALVSEATGATSPALVLRMPAERGLWH